MSSSGESPQKALPSGCAGRYVPFRSTRRAKAHRGGDIHVARSFCELPPEPLPTEFRFSIGDRDLFWEVGRHPESALKTIHSRDAVDEPTGTYRSDASARRVLSALSGCRVGPGQNWRDCCSISGKTVKSRFLTTKCQKINRFAPAARKRGECVNKSTSR